MKNIILSLSLFGTLLISIYSFDLFAEAQLNVKFKAFKTDLCTSYPEGTRDQPMLWANCCIKHDMAYWVAGDKKDLKRADLSLKECVTAVAGPFQGNLMYRGIRAGHYFPFKSKYRWGWAWQKSRHRYTPLSTQEQDYILSIIYQQVDINPILVDDFINFRFNQN